jgi:hypothetical protein
MFRRGFQFRRHFGRYPLNILPNTDFSLKEWMIGSIKPQELEAEEFLKAAEALLAEN